MIIIGYEGIGRTTLAKKRSDVIDLELSDFWVNGSEESLYGAYVSVAENLSAGGYILRYDGSIVRVDDPHSHNIKRTTLLVPAISDILDDMKEFNDLEELVDSFTINNI